MRREKLIGVLAIVATFLFAGCSGSVETGPVPTITPRPAMTQAPTPTPIVVVEQPVEGEVVETESVYDTKKFKEYYESENKLPELDEAYKDLFAIGIDALVIDVTEAERQEVLKTQFNSLSVKSDLSPKGIMDYETSKASADKTRIALDFSGADVILKFAQENNIPVRGPKLITNELPEWAFTKDFDSAQVTETTKENGTVTKTIEYASPEVIKARMENYIKDVITYCNTNYPGLIVSWDVLDDVVFPGDNHQLKYRSTSYWHQGMGEEYIMDACRMARKYATADQKLFFSQDNLDETQTLNPSMVLIEKLMAENLIDGIAIQAHYAPNAPNVFALEDMFKKLAGTGLELHITEFYVDSNEGTVTDKDKTAEEMLTRVAKRYKNIMTSFVNMEEKKSYDIISITLEGLSDDTSSLNEPKEYIDIATGETVFGVESVSFPYLFDSEFLVKDTFFAMLGDVSIKGY